MTTVNKRALADFFGVSETALSDWQQQGLPIAQKAGKRGQSNTYETADVVKWLVGREVDKVRSEQPRNRLARVQSERIEMDMARERGELVPAGEIAPTWSSHVVAARQALLALPMESAPRIRRTVNDDEAIEVMSGAIEGALRKLSEDEDEPGDDEAAARDA